MWEKQHSALILPLHLCRAPWHDIYWGGRATGGAHDGSHLTPGLPELTVGRDHG